AAVVTDDRPLGEDAHADLHAADAAPAEEHERDASALVDDRAFERGNPSVGLHPHRVHPPGDTGSLPVLNLRDRRAVRRQRTAAVTVRGGGPPPPPLAWGPPPRLSSAPRSPACERVRWSPGRGSWLRRASRGGRARS